MFIRLSVIYQVEKKLPTDSFEKLSPGDKYYKSLKNKVKIIIINLLNPRELTGRYLGVDLWD